MTRLARTSDGTAMLGAADGFVPLAAAHEDIHRVEEALPRAAAGALRPTAGRSRPIPAEDLRFGTPLESVGTVWGVGLNFSGHAADLEAAQPEEPASFIKPSEATTGPGGPIRLPSREQSERVTAEAELGVVIGRTCHGVRATSADAVIAGYLPVIDVTAEDILDRNPRYLTKAKAFDSFLVLGPTILTPDTMSSPEDMEVRTVINGATEAGNTIDVMQFSPQELVARLSAITTLHPGDVICTGTPGSAQITTGDVVRAEVDEVGAVSASVVRAD
jgi:2-keto-4-pentenoate hydratase/2-oxohepta-3-ene-1,7-dioic acid hydratase in catechol pathway